MLHQSAGKPAPQANPPNAVPCHRTDHDPTVGGSLGISLVPTNGSVREHLNLARDHIYSLNRTERPELVEALMEHESRIRRVYKHTQEINKELMVNEDHNMDSMVHLLCGLFAKFDDIENVIPVLRVEDDEKVDEKVDVTPPSGDDDTKCAEGMVVSRKRGKTRTAEQKLKRKMRKREKRIELRKEQPRLLEWATYNGGQNLTEEETEYFKVLMTRDDDLHHGVLIVDGIRERPAQFRRRLSQQLGTLNEKIKFVKPLRKGGFCITFDPTAGTAMMAALQNDLLTQDDEKNEGARVSANGVTVRVPTSLKSGDTRSVIAYNVDKAITDEELMENLLPPPESVRRFRGSNGFSKTVKITYCSEALARAVTRRRSVLLNEVEYIDVSAIRKRDDKVFCSTCKRMLSECPNGPRCNELRCARCTGHHRTKECHIEDHPCIQCGEHGHMLYKCPLIIQEKERLREARNLAKQRQNKRSMAQNRAVDRNSSHVRSGVSFASVAARDNNPASAAPVASVVGVMDGIDMVEIAIESYVEVMFGLTKSHAKYAELCSTMRRKLEEQRNANDNNMERSMNQADDRQRERHGISQTHSERYEQYGSFDEDKVNDDEDYEAEESDEDANGNAGRMDMDSNDDNDFEEAFRSMMEHSEETPRSPPKTRSKSRKRKQVCSPTKSMAPSCKFCGETKANLSQHEPVCERTYTGWIAVQQLKRVNTPIKLSKNQCGRCLHQSPTKSAHKSHLKECKKRCECYARLAAERALLSDIPEPFPSLQ